MTLNCSNDVLQKPHRDLPIEVTVRELTVLRNKHGARTPVGYRCSNIMELIQLPEVPRVQLARQVADLQRLLAAGH